MNSKVSCQEEAGNSRKKHKKIEYMGSSRERNVQIMKIYVEFPIQPVITVATDR